MQMFIFVALPFLLHTAAAAAGTTDATARTVAEIDTRQMKGEPSRLAWSPDGETLYLQMLERSGDGTAKPRHYLIAAAGGRPTATAGEPAWAAEYWAWKSAQSSPVTPSLKIQLDEQRKIVRATAAVRGGAIAGMGGDATMGTAAVAAGTAEGHAADGPGSGQNVVVRRMLLEGEVIGEFVNAGIVPGLTFGWAPAGGIAFSNTDGGIVVMDAGGAKRTVAGSKNATLPAWSASGGRLAWIESRGRNRYAVQMADVTR